MTNRAVNLWRPGEITEAQLRSCAVLQLESFAKSGRTVEDAIDKMRGVWLDGEASPNLDPRQYVIQDGDRPIAMAGTLVRAIQTQAGAIKVLGLFGVATSPTHQNQGLGDAVVQAAWAQLDEGGLHCCLFQTGPARAFYEKRGARVVDNTFIDSTHPTEPRANPFRDEVAMLYPATAEWPTGEIDLRGPGY